jgi:hypothetical protein
LSVKVCSQDFLRFLLLDVFNVEKIHA